MKIWKFPLQIVSKQKLTMPQGAQILSLQTKGDLPHIWALVAENAQSESRTFVIRCTGQLITHCGHFVGTFQTTSPAEVFHVFEQETDQ